MTLRTAFRDAEFHREYYTLTGEDPDPLMREEMEKAIREMPCDNVWRTAARIT
jgi:hypothetical protein